MEPSASLDGLPTEIQLMVVKLLGPEEILRLHSVSRLWNTLSESRYATFFYRRICVLLHSDGLNRLDALSRNEKCRQRVKEIALGPWYIFSSGWEEEEAEEANFGHDIEHLRLLLTVSTIAGAIRSLNECASLCITTDTSVVRDDFDEDDCHRSDDNFYWSKAPTMGHYLMNDKSLLHQIIHMAFAVLAVSPQIKSLTIGNCGEGFPIYTLPISFCYTRLPHIMDLKIDLNNIGDATSTGEDTGEFKYFDSNECLSSLLGFFPALKTLDIRMDWRYHGLDWRYYGLDCLPGLQSFLPVGLDCLTIRGLYLKGDDWVEFLQRDSIPNLKRLFLQWAYAEAGLGVWIQALEVIRKCYTLDELHLDNCRCLETWESQGKTIEREIYVTLDKLKEAGAGDLVDSFTLLTVKCSR